MRYLITVRWTPWQWFGFWKPFKEDVSVSLH